MTSAPPQSVLIVDDERAIRYFLSELLSDFGFDCVEATDGQQALQAMDSRDFDLMMLDIRMPGMNGLELLRQVRERGLRTRVVMLTAMGDPDVAARAITSLGADAYVGKPCTLDELKRTIDNVYERTA